MAEATAFTVEQERAIQEMIRRALTVPIGRLQADYRKLERRVAELEARIVTLEAGRE
jgi:hypothetical protein